MDFVRKTALPSFRPLSVSVVCVALDKTSKVSRPKVNRPYNALPADLIYPDGRQVGIAGITVLQFSQ
jgi:hypothetical protein